ncbi:MAG: cell surface protein SprA [Bacteroidales bacterium]
MFFACPVLSAKNYTFQQQDTTKLPLPIPAGEYGKEPVQSPLFLSQPSNINEVVEYDSKTKQYIVYEKVGQYNVAQPRVMSAEEYRNYRVEKSMRDYWKQKQTGETTGKGDGILPRMQVGGESFDRIFGSNTIEIIPQGSAELLFGITSSKTENPALPVEQRRNTTFDFQSKIQMNVTGKIGEKLKMEVNYNTEATFDFENNVKVEYNGNEDEIIQHIEAGNVSLPLPGTLITGSQSLFGFKTQLKFGKLNVTSVVSKQNGQTQVIQVKGGAQVRDFEIKADEYDANRHFFLSHYFRENYNKALKYLPVINSNISITKIEVWVTNSQANFENARNIIGFADLGETDNYIFAKNVVHATGSGPVANGRNDLYSQMTTTYAGIRDVSAINSTLSPLQSQNFSGGRDYEKVEYARKLSTNEYTLNATLGYISLSSSLNTDEVLAVAFEYTMNGQTYKVGEFSTDGISAPQTLILKLLKGTNLSPSLPTWDLMMKNIYTMNAYQVSKDDFIMDILYQNDATGTPVNYLDEGNIANKPLIQALNLDNINSQGDASSDGVFDFIDGVTINASSGKIIFPVLEPFGSDLASRIGSSAIADKYVYQELYDSTLTKARQIADKNKFILKGSYQSSGGSEIYLNAMNIPKGSVVVTAGGVQLIEDTQYIVDYNLGTVRIIDSGLLESGTTITVSVESNALYSLQTKSLVGSHFDYKFSDNFNVGATILNLTERPLTEKVSFGNEAISNTIWGLNTSYQTESKFLTKMVDWLPFIETKEKSTVTVDAEFAHFIPGSAKATGSTVYLDDFEGSSTSIDIHSWVDWKLSSTPQLQTGLFPEGSYNDDLEYGYNRARLAWYYIDPLFLRNTSLTPGYIRNSDKYQGSHWVREIYEKEIFPNRNTPQGQATNISVLNMAFYPNERGPYNYDYQNVDANGNLTNPESRWGGIMRSLSTTDFETSNIEYVEFWLMDPFVYDSTAKGGDFYIDLGSISEDILKDGRKSFESGLPSSEDMTKIDTTVWGRVPTKQYLPVGFDNDEGMRKYQDIGLDGLADKDLDGDGIPDELSFFQTYVNQLRNRVTNDEVLSEVENDPSGDNFKYYLANEFDQKKSQILDRYKYFNNTENNSPVATSTTSSQSYSTPDVEELGSDITMNENEAYYQYRISLRPEDMVVGSNYITDVVTGDKDKIANKAVKWYQFKVPISEYEKIVGSIDDFKSIRFMRMFLRGFSDTLILRFATLELVRGEWRKYNYALIQGQEGMPTEDLSTASFAISTVNIEENNKRTPVNYILPPGVSRVVDPSQSQVTELNEQSMEFKVENLADGDARAAFKNVSIDIRQYRNLKMDVHAEMIEGYNLDDGEVTAFLRLGTDYTNNYYEYEIPLKLTPYGTYNNNKESDREIVWPDENQFSISLDDLVDAKLARNNAMNSTGSKVTLSTVYSVEDGDNIIKVVGNPNLSNVKVMMIGVRNPTKKTDEDDGLAKSVTVWFNEFRLTNFNDQGGWAANARVSAKLADLGTVTIAGSTYTPGFGSIEKKVNERSKENLYEYDASASLELGKFFPEKSNVKIPVYAGYSESVSNPQYNPLDPDVTMRESLRGLSSSEKDSLKRLVQDYSRRKSINFTNVKIDKQNAKPHFWDISNFALSYSYSETYSRNVSTDHKIQRSVRGAITYNYNKQTKYITPFKNVSWLNSKYLRIIKDFNFSLFPSQISFRTDLDRSYFEQQARNLDNPNEILVPTYSKDFQWNRNYSLNWDLTQSIKFDFTASNTATIDEPDGMVDKKRDRDSYEHWRDSVWRNILKLGRNTLYNHQFNITYTLPLNKIPLLDWTSTTARYTGTYRWEAGSVLSDTSTFDPGNEIQNSNAIQLNGQLNMTNLFNKSRYLKQINQKFDQRARGTAPKLRTVKYEQDGVNLRANVAKSITHKLKADKVTVKVYDDKGKEIKVKVETKTDQRLTIKADNQYRNCKVVVEGKVPERMSPLKFIAEGSVRLLMSIKSISVSYTEANGTTLPGFKPGSKFLGMDRYNGFDTPGWEFIAGMQDPDFAWKAAEKGWLTQDTSFNTPAIFTHTENLSFRSTIEPVPGFKIDLTANRVFARNHTETFRADVNGNYSSYSPVTNGSFSISVITLGTAFEGKNRADHSRAFERMKNMRYEIANRLYQQRISNGAHDVETGDSDASFPIGFGPLSQDVLRTSFLAAYTNTSASKVTLSDFPLIPMPNWQISYDGLAKLKPFKRYFKTLTLSHGYRSLYTIGAYATNLSYEEGSDGFSYTRNLVGDFYPKREITNASINEQFSPLLGVDIGWQNNLTTRLEVKTTRTLAMSFSNTQLTETFGSEYIIGAGYRFENLPLFFESESGDKKALKSDLKLTVDFSIRDNTTVIRQIVEETNETTAGQRINTIKTSADYRISDQVTIRLYFDRVVNAPKVSKTYKTANTSFGFSVRFELVK